MGCIRGSEEERGAKLAGSSSPMLSREQVASAVSVDVERERWVLLLIWSAGARATIVNHETCLALKSVEESSVAVSKPCMVWLRLLVAKISKANRGLPYSREKVGLSSLHSYCGNTLQDGRA